MIPFARLAAEGCPSHAALALALAAEFHDPDEADSALPPGRNAAAMRAISGAVKPWTSRANDTRAG